VNKKNFNNIKMHWMYVKKNCEFVGFRL